MSFSVIFEWRDLKPQNNVRRLTDTRQRLKLLKDVEVSLTVSYQLLNEELKKRWRELAVFPDTFDTQVAASVWKVESDLAQDAISQMVKYSLVDWNEKTDRYRLHDLARLFAGEKMSDEDRYAVALLHSQHYAEVIREANRLYESGGESVKGGLDLYDLELVNIQQGLSWAVDNAENDEAAARLCSDYPNAGYLILGLRQHPKERIEWLEVQLTCARHLKDRGSEGAALGNLGLAYRNLGETRKAIDLFEQRLVIAREIGDRRGENTALWNKALALDKLGDREQAIACAEESLRIHEEIEDPFALKVREKLVKWKAEE